MTGSQRIQKALEAKGYELREAHFEPISYNGPSGREGGWYVKVRDNEEDENFPMWEKVQLPERLIGATMPSAFICYNLKDAMSIIELLPKYEHPILN